MGLRVMTWAPLNPCWHGEMDVNTMMIISIVIYETVYYYYITVVVQYFQPKIASAKR